MLLEGGQTFFGEHLPPTPDYLINHQGDRVYEGVDKCRLMQSTWEKVFTLTPLENAFFVLTHEDTVNTHLRDNSKLLSPYHESDISRLAHSSFMDTKIEPYHLHMLIKKTETQSSGTFRSEQGLS